MARETWRLWLNIDEEAGRTPLLCELARKFEVIYSIKNATVTANIGVIGIEMEGDREVNKSAVAWLESAGVKVEPVEINTIEG